MKKILIMGRSGSGKSSLAKAMCGRLGLNQLKSYTTRKPRDGEIVLVNNRVLNCSDHLFIQASAIQEYKKDIIAETIINGNEYFATVDQLKESDVYVIDYNGLIDLRSRNLDIDYITVYIVSPIANELAQQRGDSEEEIAKRFKSENEQFTKLETLKDYDYMIVNSNFNSALDSLCDIVEGELDEKL